MDLRLKYSYKFYIHVPFFHEKYIKILSKGNIKQPIKETIYIDLKHIECLLDYEAVNENSFTFQKHSAAILNQILEVVKKDSFHV